MLVGLRNGRNVGSLYWQWITVVAQLTAEVGIVGLRVWLSPIALLHHFYDLPY